MGLLQSLFGGGSDRSKASALLKQGMKKADDNDADGAIDCYTQITRLYGVPADILSMALLNRAVAYSTKKGFPEAIKDLKVVLKTNDAPAHVKTSAQQKLVRYQKLADRATAQDE